MTTQLPAFGQNAGVGGYKQHPSQRRLLGVYRTEGLFGLMEELTRYAKEEHLKDTNVSSWKKFRDFTKEEKKWLCHYLCSMEPRVLDAVLEGNLGYKEMRESAMEAAIKRSHCLKNGPQVYMNICVRVKYSKQLGTQESGAEKGLQEGAGSGPSIGIWLEILEDMKQYLRLETTTQALADEIDEQFEVKDGKRRKQEKIEGMMYLPSKNALKFLKEWVNKMTRICNGFAKGLSHDELWSDLPWSPTEVGFGVQAAVRARCHEFHEGTNHLFGLWTACLQRRYPWEFEIKVYALMDVMFPKHADIVEVLGSVLAGSYGSGNGWGLNPVLAGGAHQEGSKSIAGERWDGVWDRMRKDALAKNVNNKALEQNEKKMDHIVDIVSYDFVGLQKKLEETKADLKAVELELEEWSRPQEDENEDDELLALLDEAANQTWE